MDIFHFTCILVAIFCSFTLLEVRNHKTIISYADFKDNHIILILEVDIVMINMINGRNALPVYYMKIMINKLLSFTEYRASVMRRR